MNLEMKKIIINQSTHQEETSKTKQQEKENASSIPIIPSSLLQNPRLDPQTASQSKNPLAFQIQVKAHSRLLPSR